MKIGFSSLACPDWDIPTLIAQAKQIGYDGIELRGLEEQNHLPAVPTLAADPESIRKQFEDAQVELVSLGSDISFDVVDPYQVAEQKARTREYIELAGRLGARFVRVLAGYSPRSRWFGFEPREKTLTRIASALQGLAPVAAEHRVTVVLENQGDFCDSADVWWILDFVSHPAVAACYSPFNGMTLRERPTNAVPRLGSRIKMVQMCDGSFDASGRLIGYTQFGQGDVEVDRCVRLLRGISNQSYLMFTWPKLLVPELVHGQQMLAPAFKQLRSLLDEKSPPLTAYKGDKNAPTLGPAPSGPPARASA